MSVFECKVKDSCTNKIDVGYANPSFVICAECNGGNEMFNCVDSGNYSCDCKACGPYGFSDPEPEEPIDGSIPGRSVEEFSFFK